MPAAVLRSLFARLPGSRSSSSVLAKNTTRWNRSILTAHEHEHHEVINGSRRKRIARGSGTTIQEVNNLLRQYIQMKKMFKQMGKPSFARRMAGMKFPGM